MENSSDEQRRQQGEQTPTQATRRRPQPTAEQLARFAATDHQTKQKRKAPEPFALGVEAPARRTQAPQSSGVHNQPFLPPPSPGLQHQEQTTTPASPPFVCQASAVIPPTDPRQQLREEIRKGLELVHASNLAKRTSEVEAVWRTKRDERTKVVEDYWKEKLTEAMSQNADDKMKELYQENEKLNKQLADMKMARGNWLKDTKKYSEEMTAKLREREQEIQRLQAQVQIQPAQQSMVQGHTDALIAEGQALQAEFHNQTQDLVSLQQSCNQQAAILADQTARLNQKWQELSDCEQQLGLRSIELSEMSEELEKATKEVSNLRRESDRKSLELNESNEELGKKSDEVEKLREGRHHDSKELSNYVQQVESQSKEIVRLQASHSDSESSNQEKDRKIASLRELLDNSKSHQSTSSDQERAQRLEKQLAETQALLEIERSENASLRDQQGRRGLEDLPVEPESEAPEIDPELVRAILEQERQKIEAVNSRREFSVNATLGVLRETERERRQTLMDELERNDAELYESQKKIRELEERLLVSSPTQPAQQLPSPPTSSPPPQPSTQHSPLVPPTSPAAGSGSRFQCSRFPAPRSLLIVIVIFLLAFIVPYLQSVANSASRDELVGPVSRNDRIRWEARELANREQNEGFPTYEEGWKRTVEVGRIGGHEGFAP